MTPSPPAGALADTVVLESHRTSYDGKTIRAWSWQWSPGPEGDPRHASEPRYGAGVTVDDGPEMGITTHIRYRTRSEALRALGAA